MAGNFEAKSSPPSAVTPSAPARYSRPGSTVKKFSLALRYSPRTVTIAYSSREKPAKKPISAAAPTPRKAYQKYSSFPPRSSSQVSAPAASSQSRLVRLKQSISTASCTSVSTAARPSVSFSSVVFSLIASMVLAPLYHDRMIIPLPSGAFKEAGVNNCGN